jgi:Reverse transcriptase (RNA-dependent DNA polymerase)
VNNADSEEYDNDNSDEDPVAVDEDPVAVDEGPVDDDAEDDIATEMDVAYGERRSDHNLRLRRKVSYSHLHINFEELNLGHLEELNQGVECNEEQIKGVNGQEDKPLGTPLMSMKRGIKLFGEDGVKAVTDELKQLHDREVMKVKHSKDLTKEQRQDALAYLMWCGKYKARECADGRKQRAWTNKEDASSPTISTEAVFLTSIIDALENRDVAIFDVPGAFMQADMDEHVHVFFTGTMVDLLLKI